MMQGNVEDINTHCTSHEVLTVTGGNTQTLLTRSHLIKHPVEHGKLLICSSDEASLSVSLNFYFLIG